MKSLNIIAVRAIFNIASPIVVFEVQGHEAIIRTPNQVLTDLQNSGRALKLNPDTFKGDFANVSLEDQAKLKEAVLDTIGATLTGDIVSFKAGDQYVVTATSGAVTNPSHPLYGKVKEGDKASADKDGVRIEGFLSIPLTFQEKALRNAMSDMPAFMNAMFGLTAPAPVATPVVEEEVATVNTTAEEAFGKATVK